MGHHSTSKDFVCEVPWPSQQRLFCSHLQEGFGRKNMNFVLYVSEKGQCRLDSRIFLTEDGTAEVFRSSGSLPTALFS